jgi:2-succinyl-6-hydroxy-2,4-cyclohexadiene-1-carboxylate synthase
VRSRPRLIALHGFLGRTSDWDGPARLLPDLPITAIDLWPLLAVPDVTGWSSVGPALERAVAEAAAGSAPAFLLAYSFGARLALAATGLALPASPVRGCCLVSCHPGLAEDEEAARRARRAADEEWARRLLEWREPDIWREWDAQPVFNGSCRPAPRAGLPATRTVLARAMRRFSLAGQPDFRPALRARRLPLLWVTGASDTKFCALARGLLECGVPARFAAIEAAGHRAPWDNPAAFAALIREWTTQVMEASR